MVVHHGDNSGGIRHHMPRSLGLVFAAIRHKLGFTQSEMFNQLSKQYSPFEKIPENKKHILDENSEKIKKGGRISKYEKATSHPNFSFQHRYAEISGTRTGFLHTLSGFYCLFRRAKKAETIDQKKAYLEEIIKTAQRNKNAMDAIISEAECFIENIDKLDEALQGDPHYPAPYELEVSKKHYEFVIKFIDSFREDNV